MPDVTSAGASVQNVGATPPIAGQATIQAPGPTEWFLLMLLVIIGGSSFAMIRQAVETISPTYVAVGRLWIGAAAVYALMLARGGSLPPVWERAGGVRRVSGSWRSMIAFGAFGYAVPFSIFPWAQQFVPSGLAGVYMAFMPIWTLGLAYLFTDETLTINKLIGFFLGLFGVALLMGPEAAAGAANTSLGAQLAILVATICYAAAAVITRRAPVMRPTVFSAGSLIFGALMTTPTVLVGAFTPHEWSTASIISVVGLGLFPTGLAAFIIVTVIRRVGAGFMALSNYLTPFWAVALGAIAFGERLAPSAFVALGVIMTGVLISQRR